MNYKAGDKVKVKEWDDMLKGSRVNADGNIPLSDGYVFNRLMREYCGKEMTVKEVCGDKFYHLAEDSHGWSFRDDMLVHNNQKIVITSDGKETLARLYDGGKVVKTATAKCSPNDTFDFKTGAMLAFERLMNEGKWRVVHRKPKVGDYVRIKHNDYHDMANVGDILKVDDVSGYIVSIYNKNMPRPSKKTSDFFHWNYYFSEVEVVEPANGAVEKKKPLTFREKLKQEHPEYVGGYAGGCKGCPNKYGYIDEKCPMTSGEVKGCRECWDREIPEQKTEEKKEKPFKFEVGKQYIGSNTNGSLVIEITRRERDLRTLNAINRYEYKVVKGRDDGMLRFDEACAFADRLKPYEPQKYFNGKAVCTETKPHWAYTVGKVYEFKDGTTVINNGNRVYTDNPVKSIEEWNELHSHYAKMLEIVE